MSPPPNLSEASDQDVVARALEGKEDAYLEIVRRYGRRVFQLAYNIVGHRERAEDVAQSTFFKVFNALDRYRPELQFKPWIMRIAHNTAVDYVRCKHFDSADLPDIVTPSAIDASAIELLTPSDTLTSAPHTRRFDAALKQALRRLRPEYRRCVTLRHLNGRSYDEIAEIMHVPVGTVGTYLSRARKELKRMLTGAPSR